MRILLTLTALKNNINVVYCIASQQSRRPLLVTGLHDWLGMMRKYSWYNV